jgi:hypothetical protein
MGVNMNFKTSWVDFRKLATLLERAPVPISIAGGAVRDVVLTRCIKDYDLMVLDHHVETAVEYLQSLGFNCVLNTYDGDDSAGTSLGDNVSDFKGHWAGCIKFEGAVNIDLLVIESSGLRSTIDAHHDQLDLFDNAINQFIWYPKSKGGAGISFTGEYFGVAKELKAIPTEREIKIRNIASAAGWLYVPIIAERLAQESAELATRTEQANLPRGGESPQSVDTESW